MSPQSTDTAVQVSTAVAAPVEKAFRVFTDDIGSWWTPEHHILQADLKEMVFEPRVGGHIIDLGIDGSECRWSRVIAYEPPNRIVFSWDIDLQWQIETDPARTSEVEVRFTPEGQGTRVELEHRGWEALAEGAAEKRADYDTGWGHVLGRFEARF